MVVNEMSLKQFFTILFLTILIMLCQGCTLLEVCVVKVTTVQLSPNVTTNDDIDVTTGKVNLEVLKNEKGK